MQNHKMTCFNCRKSYTRAHRHCPHCGGDIHALGKYFKPPKVGKDKEWEAIEMIFKAGFRFHNMTGKIPRHPRDVPRFLERPYIQGWIQSWKSHSE